MSYSNDTSNLTTVFVNPGSNIDNIFTMNPTRNIFIFKKGNYYLTKVLHVTRPNIFFIGQSNNTSDVHIYQQDNTKDGIAVSANGFQMRYISLHDEYDYKVAFTCANVNDSIVEYCYFYGNKKTFSVFYAGPKILTEGQSTLDGYTNNVLDKNNIFRHNVVYSQWSGDSVSFSLQFNGLFTNNIIRGGKLAVYMCKKTTIKLNTIYDSIDSGIHISLPSENLHILRNKIYECKASGIKISNQGEHGAFTPKVYKIYIKYNIIYDSKSNAIELNDVINCVISYNKLVSSETFGIYALRSKNVKIHNNVLSYFKVAVWIESSSYVNVYSNYFMSVYPDQGDNLVKLSIDSNNNSLYDNKSEGIVKYAKYIVPATSLNNTTSNNIHSDFYSYENEIKTMKF